MPLVFSLELGVVQTQLLLYAVWMCAVGQNLPLPTVGPNWLLSAVDLNLFVSVLHVA